MRQTWLSRRAIGLHLVIIVIVPTFAALCAWQVRRALAGNQLSWAYVFEWPFFAGYAVYMWWRFLHEAPRDAAAQREMSRTGPPSETAAEPTEDPEAQDRAAYNEYLSELAARGRRKQWK
jgi:hypothetical protein